MLKTDKRRSERAERLLRDAETLSELALDVALLGKGHEAAANEFSKEAARRRKKADVLLRPNRR